jgi:hypothetical protein
LKTVGDAPKTAYEIAMEKLRAQDAARGEPPPKELSRKQKEQIGEIRAFYESKLAEREILYRSDLDKASTDPDKAREVEEGYVEDRRRLEAERDAKLSRIRE